jgi:Bacterial SH3 domain
MRGLLFLSVVGIALYALLVVTHNVLTEDGSEAIFVSQTEPSHVSAGHVSGWGAYLPSRSLDQKPRAPLERLQNSARLDPQRKTTHKPSQHSQTGEQKLPSDPAALEEASASGNGAALEWVTVTLAARVHAQGSVSSAIVRIYRPGTNLQVVGREGGWLRVSDPTTQKGGWVLEKYLASIDRPSSTLAVTEPTVEALPAHAAKSKKRSGSIRRPTPSFAAASGSGTSRWARRDNRRGFRIFGFGGRRTAPTAWSLGPAR